MEMSTQKFKHEAEHFDRTESYTSDTYHPFVGQQGDTLLITNPFRTDIKMLAHGQSTPLCTFRFNTEELAQMTKHKPVVHNIALACATCDARYTGYEMFGEYGLSYLLTRIKADGSTQNMTIMNNPEPNFPYLSAPVCASDGQLVSVMPAYMLLQTEKAYGLNQFTSAGLKPTDNPVIFLHRLR